MINDDVLRDQILDHLACVFAPGETAYVSGTKVKVEIVEYHNNGNYTVRFLCGMWSELNELSELIVYSGRDLVLCD